MKRRFVSTKSRVPDVIEITLQFQVFVFLLIVPEAQCRACDLNDSARIMSSEKKLQKNFVETATISMIVSPFCCSLICSDCTRPPDGHSAPFCTRNIRPTNSIQAFVLKSENSLNHCQVANQNLTVVAAENVRTESDKGRFVQHLVAVFEVANELVAFHFD